MSDEVLYRKSGQMRADVAREFAEGAAIMEEYGNTEMARTDIVPIYIKALAEMWRVNRRLRAQLKRGAR